MRQRASITDSLCQKSILHCISLSIDERLRLVSRSWNRGLSDLVKLTPHLLCCKYYMRCFVSFEVRISYQGIRVPYKQVIDHVFSLKKSTLTKNGILCVENSDITVNYRMSSRVQVASSKCCNIILLDMSLETYVKLKLTSFGLLSINQRTKHSKLYLQLNPMNSSVDNLLMMIPTFSVH